MHESFCLDAPVPVAPGTGPFHVRGAFYARLIEDAKTLPGGLEQLFGELTDSRISDFLRQNFQFMGWYDIFPSMPAAVTFARLRGRPFEAYMREVAREGMLKLIPSMFRVLSRLGAPRVAAAHAPRLFQTYFDCLELTMSEIHDEQGSGVLSGIPRYVAPLIVNQALGFIGGALESLGATEIQGEYRDLGLNGTKHGFELVACRGDFTWCLARKGPGPKERTP